MSRCHGHVDRNEPEAKQEWFSPCDLLDTSYTTPVPQNIVEFVTFGIERSFEARY